MSNAMLQRGRGGSYPPNGVPAGVQIQSSAATAYAPSSASGYPVAGAVRSTPSTAIATQPISSHLTQPSAQNIQSSYTTALKGGATTTSINENSSAGSNSNQQQQSSSMQKSLAHALLPDLPLLMHGSGDVLPENVDPHSVATLARMIEKYVASLVSAAMDAHDVFTDGEVVGGGACLGPPPFSSSATGTGGGQDSDEEDGSPKKRKASGQKERGSSKRKKRKRIDFWDEPLPPPGEDNDGDSINSSNDSDVSEDDSDDDAPLVSSFRRQSSSASASSLNAEASSSLMGFAPVDLHTNERTRNYYVSAPTVMDARSFIFPVCHDAMLYQRIKEVQASGRAIRRDVVDSVLMKVMKEEGAAIGRWGAVDMLDAVLGNIANNEEGNESNPEGDKKKAGGGANKAGDKDKSKGADKNKDVQSDSEKKGETNDGANMVGAGLLDDADVDPSWPGLKSLLRGSLW